MPMPKPGAIVGGKPAYIIMEPQFKLLYDKIQDLLKENKELKEKVEYYSSIKELMEDE